MAPRKQQSIPQAPRKNAPGGDTTINSGPIKDPNPPLRVSMGGKCVNADGTPAGNYTVISQTNGQDETIRYPKNTGQCGPLTMVCLDNTGRAIPGTDVVIKKGHSLRQYSTGPRTYSVVFYCRKEGDGGECTIEFDR